MGHMGGVTALQKNSTPMTSMPTKPNRQVGGGKLGWQKTKGKEKGHPQLTLKRPPTNNNTRSFPLVSHLTKLKS